MPVEQRDPRQTIKGVVLGLAAVGAAIGFLLLVVWFTNRGGLEVTLGDDVFDAGRADKIAPVIVRDGPIKYADLAGGSQHIILQHLGDDLDTGWYAFDLVRPGEPIECQLEWDPDGQVFRDGCDPEVSFPPTGHGQPTYLVAVDENGRVIVDFRSG